MTYPESKKQKNLRTVKAASQLSIVITGSTQNKENGTIFVTPKPRPKTGMEKDEEREHHLQAAMESQSMTMKGDSQVSTSIPIPYVQTVDPELTRLQRKRILSATTSNITNEEETAHQILDEDCYDLDEGDAEWLQTQTSRGVDISWDDFEKAIRILENSSRTTIITFAIFVFKCPDIERYKLSTIYDYWLVKRHAACTLLPSASLIPIINTSDADESNPYVAFRPREKKLLRRSERVNSLRMLGHLQRNVPKTDEEIERERLEHLDKLQYQVDINSEVDGVFAFKRNKLCTYKASDCFAYDDSETIK